MPKGFGLKQQTKPQYIANFMKTSRALLAGFQTPEEARQYFSNKWFDEYSNSNNNYSVEQLLNPPYRDLVIDINPNGAAAGNCKIALKGFNGIWRVMLLERPDQSLDLDIGVMAGSCYRFHSEVIKNSIVKRFGSDIYSQWRAMVKSDIESLRELIQIIRTEINSVPWSYTCSQSSARLCNQVGISTYRGVAFLFPASYK
jgi:hypothetical protein